jgi:ribonuclease VapC
VIVDASALLSIVLGEDDRARFYLSLGRSANSSVSPVNYVEAAIRADRDSDPRRGEFLDEVIQRFDVRLASITPEQAMIARNAYRRFGRGKHPARLNLGDCFAYALAKARREPLLFKGDDLAHPDILVEIERAL